MSPTWTFEAHLVVPTYMLIFCRRMRPDGRVRLRLRLRLARGELAQVYSHKTTKSFKVQCILVKVIDPPHRAFLYLRLGLG